MNNRKGFTLIELLVVVLIIGILAAMALPQYFKAVERSRMSEAVSLMANIAQAQQRKYLQINKYAGEYTGLDVSPKGATGAGYCTKGTYAAASGTGENATPESCGDGNGFMVTIDGTAYNAGKVTSNRVGPNTLQYDYTLERYYANTGTKCTGNNDNGKALCADFCGIDDYTAACCSEKGSVTPAVGDGLCGVPTAAGSGV